MALKACNHSVLCTLLLSSTSQTLVQADKQQKLPFHWQTIFAAYQKMNLMYILWDLNHHDHQLPE